MHLIGPLMSGFADAPDGHATIVSRGTASAATCWSNFKGGALNLVTTHTLDGQGRVQRYVNELVEVTVYDVDGAPVAGPFVAGANATGLEIIHAHTTGVDYDTAVSAVNKPTTLQLQLDARYSSFGAKDFKVLVGGDERNLKDVLLTGIIDVTGPTYGATGDGVTSDTTPLQAAVNAADAAGGGEVFLPPGHYIVDHLVIPSNVSLRGAGSGKSILETSSATHTLLEAAGAFTAYGIKFKSTGKGLLSFTGAVSNNTVFTACALEVTSAATAPIAGLVGGNYDLTTFVGCDFVQTGTGSTAAFLTDGCAVFGGTFTFVSGKVISGDFMALTGVYIEYQGAVTGTFRGFASGSVQAITGCTIATSGGGACNVPGGQDVVISGTSFVSAAGAVAVTGSPARLSEARESGYTGTTISAASYAPAALSYRRHFVTSTNAAFQLANPSDGSDFTGCDLLVFYKNTSGGAVTPTLDSKYLGLPVAVADGKGCGWFFSWNNVLSKFVQMGAVAAYTA